MSLTASLKRGRRGIAQSSHGLMIDAVQGLLTLRVQAITAAILNRNRREMVKGPDGLMIDAGPLHR